MKSSQGNERHESNESATTPAPPSPVKRKPMMLDRSELQGASTQVLIELARHAYSADEYYRAAAEQIGQLYMSADIHRLTGLTRSLDEPMRRAAENERTFASLLRELQACVASKASGT
jgi:hypothetical protein